MSNERTPRRSVKTTDKTTNEAMNLLFDLFERERLSEAQGLAVVLTVAGALIAVNARGKAHLEAGIRLAHQLIKRVATAVERVEQVQ